MSLHTKLMLPLIDENLTLEDISDKAGFVDVYTLDVNRPSLTYHIFLMYRRTMEPQSLKTREKLAKLKSFYSKKNVKIDNKLYVIYSFTLNMSMKNIRKNALLTLSKDDRTRIGNFWKFKDTDITDFLLGYSYLGNGFKDNVVPEEDYSPSSLNI